MKTNWLNLRYATVLPLLLYACATGEDAGPSGDLPPCAEDCSLLGAPECNQSVCDQKTGECVVLPDDGASCDDGQYCTVDDACSGGQCLGNARECEEVTGLLACEENQCDEQRKSCEVGPKEDGATCEHENPCIDNPTCQSGVCDGAPVVCTDPLPNGCHAATCNPATGLCEVAPAHDGAICSDNQCSDSVCVAGECIAVTPHPDGTTCLSAEDECVSGTCVGGDCNFSPPVDCTADEAFDPFMACTHAGCSFGQCWFNSAVVGSPCPCGTCNGGQLLSNVLLPACIPDPTQEGLACDDEDSCTTGTTCTDGVCNGGTTSATVFFTDDFSDNSAGWTLGNLWEIGPAQESSGQHPDCGNADPGIDASPTSDNGLAGVVIGGNLPLGTGPATYLTSPVFDTAGQTSVYLKYDRWLNSYLGPLIEATVEVFDGATWVEVWSAGGLWTPEDASWAHPVHNLSPYANAQMQIRFRSQVTAGFAPVCSGWNIDNVVVQDSPCN